MPEMPFEETLEKMNREGSFEASVLASSDGLPIATVPSDYDIDITAAMGALLRSVARETHNLVGLAQLDEVSVRAGDSMRLVCRYFSVKDEDFILAVVVPSYRRYYRRVTNQAIRKIELEWRAMAEVQP
jgi:predicted regulator of Ras-like GTPase activity (Roadblock/LC7/MglB family)